MPPHLCAAARCATQSRTLSSVGTALLANVKIVVLVVLSALTLGEMRQWQLREYVGCTLTFGGTAFYSRLRLLQQQKAAAAAAAAGEGRTKEVGDAGVGEETKALTAAEAETPAPSARG